MGNRHVKIALADIIASRVNQLGLSNSEVVRRCGYSNVAKGLRRLQDLRDGKLRGSDQLLGTLAGALLLPQEVIDLAIADDVQEKRQRKEKNTLETFSTHALIRCERQVPEPIWVAGVIGIDRILRIDFAEGTVPISYLKQALNEIRERLQRWNSPALPAFGRPQSIVVNYAPDRAVEFDLEGKPLRTFDKAVELGVSTFGLSGRPVTQGELDKLVGA